MTRLRNRSAFALILGFAPFSLFVEVRGDSPWDRAATDAKARLEAVGSAYKALGAYADHGTFSRSIRIAGRDVVDTKALSLAFSRPNRIVLDAGEVRLVGDGTTLNTILVPTRRYFSAPGSQALDYPSMVDGPAGAILLGGASGPPAQLLLKLVIGLDPAQSLPDRSTRLTIGEDKAWEGRTYPTLRIDQGDEPALIVLIDPETKLIRRLEYALGANPQSDRGLSGVELSTLSLAWNSGPIATEDLPASTFAFKAPDGFTRMKAAEAKPVAAEGRKNEWVGRAAPEFTLNVLDAAGKTRAVTRDDLAGKVVVLDFWATWCPPCLQELPEIQKLAETYAKAGRKDVVIVAVSQDREPEDKSSVRKLVEDLIDSKKWTLAKGPISRVALDPDQLVGDAFKIQALPTLFLLDAKGVVQAVHVGYEEGIGQTLEGEINALLEGKIPATPKDEAKAR